FLVPVDPVGDTEPPRPTARPAPKPVARSTAPIYVPNGNFKPTTKAKLGEAVDLEKRGAFEYELCGPDNPQRKEHRKASLDLLKQARAIYQSAEEEDADSTDLARRLQAVMEMIS